MPTETETAPPKKSFTAGFAASRPATESEFKAMEAGETKSPPATPPKAPDAAAPAP